MMRDDQFKLIIAGAILVAGLPLVFYYIYMISQYQSARPIQTTNTSSDFNLSSKCAADAKIYYDTEWANAPSSYDILMNYSSHYNSVQNKCFILIDYNFYIDKNTNIVSDTAELAAEAGLGVAR